MTAIAKPRWVLVVLLLLFGCRQTAEIDVLIKGRPVGVSSMLVSAELNLTPAVGSAIPLTTTLDHFRVELDAAKGYFTLRVNARNAAGCDVSAGEGMVQLDGPGRYPLEISMTMTTGCSLEIEIIGLGNGTVTSKPTGIDCSTHCTQKFALGQRISLTANKLQAGSIFGGWFANVPELACTSRGVCAVSISSGVTKIRANFLPWNACDSSNWCFEPLLPTLRGQPYAIWGSQRDDVWIVGDVGSLLHGDGITWSNVQPVTYKALRGIWGSSRSNVWAVGESGTILHFDGFVWEGGPKLTDAWLTAIWGSSSDDVWAVGDHGTVLHFDGATWTQLSAVTQNDLRGIWGRGPDEVWIVGDHGTVLHFDGSTFTAAPGVPDVSLHGVWGSESPDVWIVGDGGKILRIRVRPFLPQLVSSPSSAGLYAIFGTSSQEIWAVGVGGVVLQSNGIDWQQVMHPFAAATTLSGIWGSSPQDVWTVGDGNIILRYRPDSWN